MVTMVYQKAAGMLYMMVAKMTIAMAREKTKNPSSLAQLFNTLGVAGKFENTKHTEHPERDKCTADVFVALQTQANVIGKNGHHVDDAHHGSYEFVPVRSRIKTQQIFNCKNDHTSGVDDKKLNVVQIATGDRLRDGAFDGYNSFAGYGLDHIAEHGDGNEKAGDVIKGQRRGAAVGVFKSAPHFLPYIQVGQNCILGIRIRMLFHQTFLIFTFLVFVIFITAVADHL
ncbi:hypothetical protein T05_4505 [Trichinella murrelli]|uniref:Uncharacterized protein n=1 Tax=Trichinella murrelli TaxID=144512 RepID=A0A0V0U9V0_9BILA|nr:hypothetical protein T05_4505 [Trichinella murrelli]